MKTLSILGAAALLLSACGNTPDAGAGTKRAIGFAKGVFVKTDTPAGPTTEEALVATLTASNDPVAVFAIEASGVAVPFAYRADNGPVRTWANGSRQTVSTNRGVVVATRGYGADLMSSDNPDLITMIARRSGGTYERTNYYNNGNDRNGFLQLPCTVNVTGQETVQTATGAVSATKIVEDCGRDTFAIQNTYWVNGNGTAIQARQWISPEIGYMVFSQVRG